MSDVQKSPPSVLPRGVRRGATGFSTYDARVWEDPAMGYSGAQATSVGSTVAIACAVAVVLGYTPMLAVLGMVAATVGMARGEGLAGIAVPLGIIALFVAFVLPSATWLS